MRSELQAEEENLKELNVQNAEFHARNQLIRLYDDCPCTLLCPHPAYCLTETNQHNRNMFSVLMTLKDERYIRNKQLVEVLRYNFMFSVHQHIHNLDI